MTPTREQLTAWVAQATAYATSQTNDFQEHGEILSERFATLAMAAGRDQGLREAALICRVTPPEPFRPSIEAAHAIEQLRGK